MKAINYENLDSLYHWMDFIVNEKDVSLESIDCNLKIFGEGDDACLVINIFDNDASSTEYYFKHGDEENGLTALISFMSTFNFSLKKC